MAKRVTDTTVIEISPPKLEVLEFRIRGTAPYVQHKFSEKAKNEIRSKQASTSKGRTARAARDFDQEYLEAMHTSSSGNHGIPASAFRAGMIDACRVAGLVMTQAKMAMFCIADEFTDDGMGLVSFTKGKPKKVEHTVKIQNTTTIAVRAMWDAGWEATVRIQYDTAMYSSETVANLLMRVGMQVGIGEGRPFSKSSAGMGWGTFEIVEG